MTLSTALPINTRSITQITVNSLFGRYNYELPAEQEHRDELSRAFILYGGNGSGKTTILQLLFNLISPAHNRGHRHFLANVPFKVFAVTLGNHTTIAATRPEPDEGAYTISIQRHGSIIDQAYYEPDLPSRHQERSEDFDRLVSLITALNIDVYFLSEDRKVRSDSLPKEEDDIEVTRRGRLDADFLIAYEEAAHVRRALRGSQWGVSNSLQSAIDRTVSWVNVQAKVASNVGDANANTIYTDVVRRITEASSTGTSNNGDISQLVLRLRELATRSVDFARFGLISPFELDELTRLVAHAPEGTHRIVWDVLQPHVDSMRARLDALQLVQQLVETFVNSVNSFYEDKHLEFDVTSGIKIVSSDGANLPPEVLSSGEKQLLLLLCYTLYARDQASIVIIDEPELSLNVAWQRHLLDALLESTKGSFIQFVLATHSIELLSRHRGHLVPLTRADGSNVRAVRALA